jgi:rSAM/selenodomain-associated transferase 2
MISIIIPTYNENEYLGPLIKFLKENAGTFPTEILIADGGSTDNTLAKAKIANVRYLQCPIKCRAVQMNFAASHARGSILYFVHADCFPPGTYARDIQLAIEAGYLAGRYQTKFISESMLLRLNAFFTRFDLFACYGGDQTLFICRKFFTQLGGFDESKVIMEDFDITNRIKENNGRYKIFDKPALVSARKYTKNSWLAVQKANYTAVKMYKKGVAPALIALRYREMLRF